MSGEKEPIDWDALDADTQHELVSLADKLGEDEAEQEPKRTASRREFLGAITAAGLGGSLLSQGTDRAFEAFVNPASAGTQSVAQFGEAGEPFDFVAEDIYGPGGQGSGDPVNFEQIGSSSNRVSGIYGDSVDANSVSTGEIFTADVGELQSVLSSASAGDYVMLRPGQNYDPGSETTIPQDVALDFNGATFAPSADYNGFFVDHGATIKNGHAETFDGYASDVVVLDTSRAGSAYRWNDDTGVSVEMDVYGSGGTGQALHLVADGAFGSITVGNWFEIQSWEMSRGIQVDITDSFVNGVEAVVGLANNVKDVEMNATGSPSACTMRLSGWFQTGTLSEFGIHMTGGTSGPIFRGVMYDQGNYSQATLDGNDIQVHTVRRADSFQGNCAGSGGVMSWTGDELHFYVVDDDDVWRHKFDKGVLSVEKNGTGAAELRSRSKGGGWSYYSGRGPMLDDGGAGSDTAANNTLIFNQSESRLELKNSNGDVHYWNLDGTV